MSWNSIFVHASFQQQMQNASVFYATVKSNMNSEANKTEKATFLSPEGQFVF